MTFEELKFEVIKRTRILQVDSLLFLYIKAQNYSDLLKVMKSSGNFDWILDNGFRDLAQYVPVAELEAENIYQRDITLSDQNKDIIMLSGTLTMTQSGTNLCKVISDSAVINATINDSAMLEFEFYQSTTATIITNGYSLGYITTKGDSNTEITANDQSTIKVIGWGDTITSAEIGVDAFLNSELNDNATLNPNNQNFYARTRDESKIITSEI